MGEARPAPVSQAPVYGLGVYRRRIRLIAEAGAVVGDLEDDFHRFRLVLRHDGRQVTDATAEARRFPWTSCPGAEEKIPRLRGLRLTRSSGALAAHTERRQQCTHLFDLAALVVAHAAAGRERRQYDVCVPDRVEGRTRPKLYRDGVLALEWTVDGHRVLQPKAWAGVELGGGQFLRWAEAELDPESAEAAIVLRRACYIAAGRAHKLDAVPNAAALLPLAGNACHAFQPEVAQEGLRVVGTTLDFTDAPDALLADLDPAS